MANMKKKVQKFAGNIQHLSFWHARWPAAWMASSTEEHDSHTHTHTHKHTHTHTHTRTHTHIYIYIYIHKITHFDFSCCHFHHQYLSSFVTWKDTSVAIQLIKATYHLLVGSCAVPHDAVQLMFQENRRKTVLKLLHRKQTPQEQKGWSGVTGCIWKKKWFRSQEDPTKTSKQTTDFSNKFFSA